jgi:hypothetical protein
MSLKVAFDVGGVLSKHKSLQKLFITLSNNPTVEVHVISDMHPKEKIVKMLELNGLSCPNIHSADYSKFGENCKKEICENLGIDILIDDFIGYVAEGDFTRLLVMPQPSEPYYSDDWKTDGSEGDFGRRIKNVK